MHTRLDESLKDAREANEAREILQSCVHCGFCLAACPTYRLLGDELDSPRGRIYLVKQVLEGVRPTALTQGHLDRCLTCRACETACPSGVEYGRLIEIGREMVAGRVRRPASARAIRAILRWGLTSRRFRAFLRVGQALRRLLPASIAHRIPEKQVAGAWPARSRARKMILPVGCVQPSIAPGIDAATARVCDAIGIGVTAVAGAGCCGAIALHLDDPAGARDAARRNIDAWWPHVEQGADAVLMNASGCGVTIREYGRLLRDDPAYADRARRISAIARDLAEVLPAHGALLAELVAGRGRERVVFHPPCTLQHGQKVRGAVEALLSTLGADVLPFEDAGLCCGSAGTYSLLEPAIAARLRDRKLAALAGPSPAVILSANVGCIAHLAAASPVPVRHWVEWVDERLLQ